MKITELLSESIIDKMKSMLGAVKGKVISSMSNLLKIFKKHPTSKLTTIEEFEVMSVGKIKARVDTGATVCSIHGEDTEIKDGKVKFKFEGKLYTSELVEMKTVKSASGVSDRPRIKMDYKWGGTVYRNVLTNVTDRSKLKFKLLVGRNLIKDLKLPVHVSDSETEE